MRIRATRVKGDTAQHLGDLGDTLEQSCAKPKQGKILEIMCTRELGDPFRRDAFTKPVRLLEKYKEYTVA